MSPLMIKTLCLGMCRTSEDSLLWHCVNIAVWMHYMDVNKRDVVKPRWELHNNAMSYFEQILEATPPENCSLMATYLLSQKSSE